MSRSSFALLTLMALLPLPAQAEEPEIWEKAVMPQPFEKRPFRPIKIPAWLQDTTGVGYTLSVLDSDSRAAAAKHGVTISEMGFVDPFFAYYDSKLLKRRSPHVPVDRLAKDIAEYKRLGIRILGVYPPTLQGEVYETHPDWRRVSTDTLEIPQIDMKKFAHGGMLCPLGPYGDFFIAVLAEILTTFPDVDAFSFDGLHYAGVCYCGHCRDAYRKEAGKPIPPKPDLADPAFRRYQHWADRRMEDLIERMQTRLKGIKPTVALVTWTTNAGRFGHFRDLPRNMPARMNLLLDAPDQEFWLDETNRGASIVPAFANAYIWATTNHRVAFSEPYLMSHGNPYGKDSFPPHEVLRRMMLALTHGASPSLAVIQPAPLKQAALDGLDALQARKPWLTHKKPEPWAALVMSDNTRAFYGRNPGLVEERYMAHVFGAFRATIEEHLPVAVINDWNLNADDLAKYKVLILPNTASLDTTQVAAIEGFVAKGGGLVASLDTSLFDEFGDPRADFALGKVLGVRYRGLPEETASNHEEIDVNFAKGVGPDYWEKRKGVFDFKLDQTSFLNQGLMKTYVGNDSVTFKGPAVRVEAADPSTQAVGVLNSKTDGKPVAPAILTHPYGKGRAVYLASGFDAAYYLYAYPYHRLVLCDAVRWASSGAAMPVEVQAPMCVQSSVMRQTKDGERLVVHLFNDVNTTAFHALATDDVPLREETIPIHDIQVKFAPAYTLGRIHLEPGGQTLTPKRNAQGATLVVVPRLDVHAMVVAELPR